MVPEQKEVVRTVFPVQSAGSQEVAIATEPPLLPEHGGGTVMLIQLCVCHSSSSGDDDGQCVFSPLNFLLISVPGVI